MAKCHDVGYSVLNVVPFVQIPKHTAVRVSWSVVVHVVHVIPECIAVFGFDNNVDVLK